MTATQAAQGAQVEYLGAIAQRLQDTVALYVALGGGWWTADPAAAVSR
jgi:outer membrane protein TolC